MTRSLLLIAALALGAAACTDSASRPAAVRTAMLTDLADRAIAPAHRQFTADATALSAAADALDADPTPATLGAAQSAWITAATGFQRLAALNVPGVQFGLYHNRISTWPTRTGAIDDAVASDEALDADFVAARGSNARGLPALEYLLFADDAEERLTDPRRRAYVRALAADVSRQATALERDWARDGGNQLGYFVEADTEGRDLQSSVSRLVNEMAMVAEDLQYQQVGRPLGVGSRPQDATGTPAPDAVEAPYAGVSLDLIRAELAGLRALVTGGGGTGLDDYLAALDLDDRPLGEVVLERIDAADDAAAAIGMPLEQAVTEHPQAVRALYDASGALLRSVKTDLANRLGVSITFSDNDGD